MKKSPLLRCVLGLVACVALVLIVGACAATGKVTVPGGSMTWDYSLKTYTLQVPANRCWSLTFKDANGNQVGDTVTGMGPSSGHMPEGAVDFTYAEVPCGEAGGLGGDPNPQGFELFRYQSGRFYIDSIGSADLLRHTDILALTQTNADQKYSSVVIGQPLPSYTTVAAFITYDLDATSVTIHSSLPSRFAQFQIDVNGNIVAEIGNGVTPTYPGNGWVTQTVVLPLGLFIPSNVVTLTQNGVQSGLSPVVVDVSF